jgi:hypothetical protein
MQVYKKSRRAMLALITLEQTGVPGKRLFFRFDRGLDVDDLAAAVETVFGHVVTDMGFTGCRIGSQLLGGQSVMRTAHATG